MRVNAARMALSSLRAMAGADAAPHRGAEQIAGRSSVGKRD
jgi:hypothetical protein